MKTAKANKERHFEPCGASMMGMQLPLQGILCFVVWMRTRRKSQNKTMAVHSDVSIVLRYWECAISIWMLCLAAPYLLNGGLNFFSLGIARLKESSKKFCSAPSSQMSHEEDKLKQDQQDVTNAPIVGAEDDFAKPGQT